ncbi:inositol monophosphatase family protein [Paenibacillus peoriae]|uniref:inositol monophosphatase family protein n=1 Tax=Paenibacillus peoriae TaxID=59893 RepID=UPI00026C5800|nr:inositol monophosphatase family protein [Paenibacillus peoriae]MEC0182724.1 inositol monophosphatase family protein [Paenibacillus peoriae]
MDTDRQIYEQALGWVREAGSLILKRMEQTIHIQVKKNHADLVTVVDREVEAFFVNNIQQYYADHNILGEENIGNRLSDSPYLWIIDPIDGTTNFINRKKDFAISVALCNGDQGIFGIVYDVVADHFYCAFHGEGAFLNENKLGPLKSNSIETELLVVNAPRQNLLEMSRWEPLHILTGKARGVRSYGATTIELCDVMTGMLGGYVQAEVNAWDYAACRIILEEIGGKFTDLQGNEINRVYKGGLVAAGSPLHEEIIQALNK